MNLSDFRKRKKRRKRRRTKTRMLMRRILMSLLKPNSAMRPKQNKMKINRQSRTKKKRRKSRVSWRVMPRRQKQPVPMKAMRMTRILQPMEVLKRKRRDVSEFNHQNGL